MYIMLCTQFPMFIMLSNRQTIISQKNLVYIMVFTQFRSLYTLKLNDSIIIILYIVLVRKYNQTLFIGLNKKKSVSMYNKIHSLTFTNQK